MMKSARIIALLLLVTLVAGIAGAQQEGQSWARLYKRLPDIKQKYAVLQNLTPLDDRSLEPFYYDALSDLVYGDLSRYRESKNTYDDWEILTRTIIKELGEIKGQTASDIVWDVVRSAEVPLLKSEAMIALGQMRATEYADELAMILRNLNFNTGNDKNAAEIEAYGAVVALDKMKDPAGFDSLFFASIGWYSDRVTTLAGEAVLTLTDDPVARLDAILLSTQEYRHKRAALATAVLTDATPAEKSAIAVTGLSEGLRYSETDYTLSRELANLRVDSMNVLLTYGAEVEGAPKLLNKAIDEGDLDEQLLAITVLGAAGDDESVTYLADRLANLNDRQISGLGLNNAEQTIIRQLIFSLGEAGNTIGLEPLTQMAYIDYTPALIRLSKEAIEKINGQ